MTRPGPKPGGPAKGTPTGIRFEHVLKKKIAAAAKKAKRSFSDEVDIRLRQSFENNSSDRPKAGVLLEDFGTAKSYALMLVIAKAIREVECWTDKEWDRDAFTLEQAKAAAHRVLDGLFVSGETDRVPPEFPALRHCPEDEAGEAIRKQIGEEVLARGLGNICGAQAIDELRTAVSLLSIEAQASPTDARPGSGYRISLTAAKEFQRRNMSYFMNLLGNNPMYYFCRKEMHFTPLGCDEPTHIVAVYRWRRPSEKSPQGEMLAAPVKGCERPVTVISKVMDGGLGR